MRHFPLHGSAHLLFKGGWKSIASSGAVLPRLQLWLLQAKLRQLALKRRKLAENVGIVTTTLKIITAPLCHVSQCSV